MTCANCDYSASADCDYEETAHPATCQVGAYTTYKCRNCGYTYDGEQGATASHSFTDYRYNNDATCSADGTETAACDFGCGETATRTAAGTATGAHAWKWAVDTAPTCGEAGVKHQKCENCDATQNENTAIPATGAHSFGEWVVTKDATCVAAGEQTRTCAVCGKTEKKAVKKLDHVWGEWTDDEDSTVTCTSGGTQHRTCENCGETEARTVEGGVGHVVEHSNLRGEGYCKYCGEFRCSMCEKFEQNAELPVIGIFYTLIHFFIHMAHMISFDRSIVAY